MPDASPDQALATAGFDPEAYRRDGYQIVRGLLARSTTDAVRGFLEESLDSSFTVLAPWGIRRGDPDNGRKAAEILAGPQAPSLPDEVRMVMLGHFPLPVRLSDRLWPVPRDPGMRALVRAVLGSDCLFMHMPPAARFVLPRNLRAIVPAHHDASYAHFMREFITVWVPFVEIDDQCGSMTMFEGSQNEPAHIDEIKTDQWIKAVPTAGYTPRACSPLSPGDVVVFNRWIIHESLPNLSARIRFSIDYRFFAEGVISAKHALDMQQWRVLPPGESGRRVARAGAPA
jgi:hypothetical protein